MMTHRIKRFLLSIKDLLAFSRSYSQDGEDMALAAFYDVMKGYKGFYVDVGAHHPVRFSNTYHFYLKGWRGINIDAMPGSMKWFNLLRRRDVNLEIGIGTQPGELTFYCFNEPALNTFDEELAREREMANDRYRLVRTQKVKVSTLANVLDTYLAPGQSIDFLSVDVEGLDLEVLKSNNWSKYRPKFLLVEDLKFNLRNVNDSSLVAYLEEVGYEPCSLLRRTVIFRRKS